MSEPLNKSFNLGKIKDDNKRAEVISAKFRVGIEVLDLNYDQALDLAMEMCQVYKGLVQDIVVQKFTSDSSCIRYVGPGGATLDKEPEPEPEPEESEETKKKQGTFTFNKRKAVKRIVSGPNFPYKQKGRKPGSKNKKKVAIKRIVSGPNFPYISPSYVRSICNRSRGIKLSSQEEKEKHAAKVFRPNFPFPTSAVKKQKGRKPGSKNKKKV